MPSHDRTRRFERDWLSLTATERERFRKAFARFDEDLGKRTFRPGLRVKRVLGTDRVYEMTWAPDGRATFELADSPAGEVRVLWRRIGTHDVFRRP